jgi:hypothetical protein
MRQKGRLRVTLTHGAIGLMTVGVLAMASPAGAAPANVHMPFPCGETWYASSYTGHFPSPYAVDWNLPGDDQGRSVQAGVTGTATAIPNNGGYGNMVEVNAGGGWTYRYAHLSVISIATGQQVNAQTELGKVGNTGNSTGSHLHYEQRYNNAVQPATFNGQSIAYTPNFPGSPYTSTNCTSSATTARPDLYIVQHANTASGKVEAKTLGGTGYYSGMVGDVKVTPEGWHGGDGVSYVVADRNLDGVPDLYQILHLYTGSGMTEIKIWSGATNFSTQLGPTWVTPDGWHDTDGVDYVVGDRDHDGQPDLYIIQHLYTDNGYTKVHVLSGGSNFSAWVGQWTSVDGWHWGNDVNYGLGDWEHDGTLDLYEILHNDTPSGYTEVKILNGATNFASWTAGFTTPDYQRTSANTDYAVADFDQNGSYDVFVIVHNGTPSGYTEVEILNGSTGFGSWIGGWVTPESPHPGADMDYALSR